MSASPDTPAPTRGPNCFGCKHFAVSWDAALNSKVALGPAQLAFGEVPVAPVAIPGSTKDVF